MSESSDDPRKQFILATAGNFYGVRPVSTLFDSPELNTFLDDGNEFLLSVNRKDNDLHFSNKVNFLSIEKCALWAPAISLFVITCIAINKLTELY